MAKATPFSLLAFQQQFSSESSCEAFLFKQRWANGFICPKCEHTAYYPIQSRKLYECRQCGHQTSLTAGTVMHKSKLSLRTWFWAIYLTMHDKRGRSALALAGLLQLNYRTAWRLLHKIRYAMKERDSRYKLSGLIEMDEAYFGAPKPGTDGRGTKKTKVAVALQTNDLGHPLYLRLTVIEAVTTQELKRVAKECIVPGSTIVTDGLSAYQRLNAQYHHIPKEKQAAGKDFLKWVHVMISNTKTYILGTYHGGLGQDYLQAYLDEFCYRFNRRFFPDQLFGRLLNACISSPHVTIA